MIFVFRKNDFSAGTEKDIDEYVVVIEKMECDLLLDNEYEIQRQQRDIDEDDVFKDIEAERMVKAQVRNQHLEDEEFEEDANVGTIEDLRNYLLESEST